MPLLLVAAWTLIYVAVYPWGDLAAGLGFVAAGAMGAWLGARRGGTAVGGWALAGYLATGGSTPALAVALAQVATALVLGQLRDLRLAAEDEARLTTSPAAEQLLRYCRALLRPERADAIVLHQTLAVPAVRALHGGTVLVVVVDLDGEVVELALERARPFDADERAVAAMLLRNLDGATVPEVIAAPAPTELRRGERALLAVG